MEDPNLAVAPDYTLPEFAAQRQAFQALGLTDQQATNALGNLWTVENNKAKTVWQQCQQDIANAKAEAKNQADQLRIQQEEEEAQALKDEHKKNKTKFMAIPDRPVPSHPLVLPSLVAVHKIKNHQFCELWYFTNAGLDAAKSSLSFAADNNSLSFVPSPDGSHVFIPSAFANDKAPVIQDDSLLFKQFSQATLCMVTTMRDCGWIDEHVNMHIKFWSNIENHTWGNSKHASQQCALLVYQSEQRRYWHTTIGGPNAFNLAPINEVILTDTHNRILLKTNNDQFRLIQAVSTLFPPPNESPN